MRILGIDPGLERTGYGIIEIGVGSTPYTLHPAPVLIEAGLIRTSRTEALPRRLARVAQGLKALIGQHKPDIVAVEDLYSYYKTPKPAILMGHVRGVVLGTAALTDIPVFSYFPTRIKQAVVGQGHATKSQVARLVQVRLNLKDSQVPPDVTDALAVALCHADQLRVKSQK